MLTKSMEWIEEDAENNPEDMNKEQAKNRLSLLH